MRRSHHTRRREHDHGSCRRALQPPGTTTALCQVGLLYHAPPTLASHILIIVHRAERRPTWGTCAGMILLAEAANRTKKGGQELIGGLDVRVERNHFGRQTESFEADLDLDFLKPRDDATAAKPFRGVFIRAPIVQRILAPAEGEQVGEGRKTDTVVAPSRTPLDATAETQSKQPVLVKGVLRRNCVAAQPDTVVLTEHEDLDAVKIVAVQQGNVFGTSFHPELTGDARIHEWWLHQIFSAIVRTNGADVMQGP